MERRVINQKLGHLYSSYFGRRKNNIIRCGIVSEPEYSSRRPRIVFFLKEANSNDKGWSWPKTVRDQVVKVAHGGYFDSDWRATGYTVGTWAYALHFGFKRHDSLTLDDAAEGLRYVGMTNVKKEPGQPNSDAEEIRKRARRDVRLWRRELEIMDPDLIVCGGYPVFDSVADLLELDKHKLCRAGKDIRYSLWELDGHRVVILDFYHPAYVQHENPAKLYRRLEKVISTMNRKQLLRP
jgi:hypothetical protein